MEKSTIYRAISAPTALVGGLASIIAGVMIHCWWCMGECSISIAQGVTPNRIQQFFGVWLCVLFITGIANTYFIWRGAVLRKEPFISAGMKMALLALFPPLMTGGIFTLICHEVLSILAPIWMICYGLGLIATRHFSPSSIPRLGWAFLITGLSCFLYFKFTRWDLAIEVHLFANIIMTATFGLFHLIYAACTWPRKTSPTS